MRAIKSRKLHILNSTFPIAPGIKFVKPKIPPADFPNISAKPISQYIKSEIPISVRFFIATFMLFFSLVRPDSTI